MKELWQQVPRGIKDAAKYPVEHVSTSTVKKVGAQNIKCAKAKKWIIKNYYFMSDWELLTSYYHI